MKITVAIPVFNRERYVGIAVRSLLRQRPNVDIDILVVDDGSTDESAAVVKDLQATCHCIRLVSQPNRGVAGARNTALRNLLPETALVSFLDSDDVATAERFADDLRHFESNLSLGMVYSRMMLVKDIEPNTMVPRPDSVIGTLRGVSLTTATFRRRVVDEIGLFDESLSIGEDLDYLLRIFEQGYTYALSDHVSVLYRRHDTNMTSNGTGMRRGVMHALLKSAKRRASNPSLVGRIPPFLDLAELDNMRRAMECEAVL